GRSRAARRDPLFRRLPESRAGGCARSAAQPRARDRAGAALDEGTRPGDRGADAVSGLPDSPCRRHDVDPLAEERSDYALSCRVFRTEAGLVGQRDERWVREALMREAGTAV